MSNVSRCLQIAFLLLSYSAASLAQDARSGSSDTNERQSRQVIGALTESGMRFSSLGALVQIRLEVLGAAGDPKFNSGFRSGNVVDWRASDNQGQRLENGTYLCVVTVRDSAGRETRTHAMAILQDNNVMLKKTDTALLGVAQQQVATGFSNADADVTIVESNAVPASAVLAHDGTMSNLVTSSGGLSISSGDFFANKVRQHIRLTAEGNIGLGVPDPVVRLDVDGLIRASGGIVFPDGSVQFSAARKTFGAESLRPGQFKPNRLAGQEQVSPQATGAGTQNHLARWTDNLGTLGDSAFVEVSGSVGLGVTNPQTGFDYKNAQAPFFTRDFSTNPGNAVAALRLGLSGVGSRNVNVGPSFLFFSENSAGTTSFLGRVSAIWENPTAGSEAGAIFFQTRANSADVNALAERMRITAGGNVGIGTGIPGARLHVLGASSNGNTPVGILDSTGNQIPLFFSSNGTEQARIRADLSGNLVLATVNGGSRNIHLRAGDDASTDVFIQSSTGNVGIGTTSPATRLEVRDGDVRSSGSGGRFSALNPNNQSALVHFDWFNDGTNDWPRIRFGGSGEGASNGFLIQGLSDTTKLAVLQNGRVGIGTITPAQRLHVAGNTFIDGNVGIGTSAPGVALDVLGPGTSSTIARFRQSTSNAAVVSIDAPAGQDSILSLLKDGVQKWNIRNDSDDGNRFKIRSVDTDGTNHTRLTVEPGGKVGIGTTDPSHQFDVEGSSSDGHIAAIINNDANDNEDGLLIVLNSNNPNPQHTNNYITFSVDDPLTGRRSVGSIQGNGSGGVEIGGPGADYAEWLPRLNSAEKIQPGEIVGLYGSRITKNTQGAMRVMVVSTGAIVAGNDPGERARNEYERVAFIGQAEVRVRGAVQAGDFIIASGLNDGIGLAVSPDCISSEQFAQVIGQAWQSSSDPGIKSVRTAVGLIQHDPTVKRLLDSNRDQAARITALDARLAAVESSLKKFASGKTTVSRTRLTSGHALVSRAINKR